VAASFLLALKERYEAIQSSSGLPAMGDSAWVGTIPEGTAQSLATGNVVCRHRGEVPHYQKDHVAYEIGRADFEVYRVGLANADATGRAIKDGFGMHSLTIDGKSVALYRSNYLVEESWMRGPGGEFVFKVTVSYMAEITNSMSHGLKGNLPSR
jgi:hypothetical protein